MITLRSTRKGLEIMRYLPFTFFGNEGGRASSSSDCPALPNITEKEVKNGRDEKSTRKD